MFITYSQVMLMLTVLTIALGCGAVLWWRLSNLKEQNAQLSAELSRLRKKLRALQI